MEYTTPIWSIYDSIVIYFCIYLIAQNDEIDVFISLLKSLFHVFSCMLTTMCGYIETGVNVITRNTETCSSVATDQIFITAVFSCYLRQNCKLT